MMGLRGAIAVIACILSVGLPRVCGAQPPTNDDWLIAKSSYAWGDYPTAVTCWRRCLRQETWPTGVGVGPSRTEALRHVVAFLCDDGAYAEARALLVGDLGGAGDRGFAVAVQVARMRVELDAPGGAPEALFAAWADDPAMAVRLREVLRRCGEDGLGLRPLETVVLQHIRTHADDAMVPRWLLALAQMQDAGGDPDGAARTVRAVLADGPAHPARTLDAGARRDAQYLLAVLLIQRLAQPADGVAALNGQPETDLTRQLRAQAQVLQAERPVAPLERLMRGPDGDAAVLRRELDAMVRTSSAGAGRPRLIADALIRLWEAHRTHPLAGALQVAALEALGRAGAWAQVEVRATTWRADLAGEETWPVALALWCQARARLGGGRDAARTLADAAALMPMDAGATTEASGWARRAQDDSTVSRLVRARLASGAKGAGILADLDWLARRAAAARDITGLTCWASALNTVSAEHAAAIRARQALRMLRRTE